MAIIYNMLLTALRFWRKREHFRQKETSNLSVIAPRIWKLHRLSSKVIWNQVILTLGISSIVGSWGQSIYGGFVFLFKQ